MSFKITNPLAADAMSALRTALNGGRLYYYAGAEPTNAGDALDMVSTHTELCVLTLNGGGTTGLTFEPVTGDSLIKTASEVWQGLVAFSGAQAGLTTLTPTFFRFCAAGDDGRDGAGTRKRIQGSIGGPASGADLMIGSSTLTRNGSNTESLGSFVFRARTNG